MTANHRAEQPQAGGTRVVQRLRRRFSAARSARPARADLGRHPGPLVALFATVDEEDSP